MDDRTGRRLECLKSLRATALDAIDRAEASLPLLSGAGDEHIRDATETWLEHHRAFATKLGRRIALEDPGFL